MASAAASRAEASGAPRRTACGSTVEQAPRLLVGGAAHHDAVDAGKVRRRLASSVSMPPLSTMGSPGSRALSRYTRRIIERRHLAVLPRRQARQAMPCGHGR